MYNFQIETKTLLPSAAKCNHASTIVELNNFDLMVAWFAGSAEGNPDVAIWFSRRAAGVWTDAKKILDEPGVACYNPVLFYTHDGKLWFYYKFGLHPDRWTAGRCWSVDEGVTWTPVEYLPAGLYGPVRAKPLILADGTVVSGTSVETYLSWACWIERSTDDGATWSKIGPVTVPEKFTRKQFSGDTPLAVPGSEDWHRTKGIIQPSVIRLNSTKLRLYARPTARVGRICIADSEDEGLTWSQARPIDVPNPNSGVDAVGLRDGRVALIYNHSDSARTPLNLAISSDGERFQMVRVLEDKPGEYSYPAIIEGKDGDLHITYTLNRERIAYVHVPVADI